MTTDKDFKRLIRERAQKTGESYALARRRLLSKSGGPPVPSSPGELEHLLVLSQDQARILGHGFIGTEHILLGLIVEEHGFAAGLLAAVDVTLEKARSKIQDIIDFTVASAGGSLPQTPRTQKVIDFARQEVINLGHASVGSGHLLLGLLNEGEGVAVRVLKDLNVNLQELRVATLRAMGVGDSNR